MRVLLAFSLCLFIGASSAQAQGWKSLFRVPALPAKTLSVVQRRALVSSYGLKVEQIVKLNRLALPPARLPLLERSTRNYYKTVAVRFPDIAVKPMNEAKNTLEDMLLSLPASLKAETVLVEKIPNILRPTEAYLSAMLADAWGNWLESGIGSRPPAEMAVSRADMKTARALYSDLSAGFDKLYAELPAEQKDLSAQLSRVMENVSAETGWDAEVIADLERYFSGILSPMVKKQDALTAREFLQAYDVLAVAAELGVRYKSRLAKGMTSLPHFLLNESIQRVRKNLAEGFIPAEGSARERRLQKWYNGLFGRERF